MDGVHLNKPSYQIHDGFRMPLGFPPEGFASALEYEAQRGDIFVASYVKCGTTWMQYIVYLLLHDGVPLPGYRSLSEVFPHLEEVGRDAVRALPQPRLIKTHLPHSMLSFEAGARYVYVARNPFDCAVSFYHHTRGFVRHYDFASGTFDEFFECFVNGEVDFGDYFDNLMSWYPHAGARNVLFMTYEQMSVDARAAILSVGRFLGGRALRAVEEADILDAIVRESGFPSMRENQRRWSSARPPDMPEFVRKGIVGDWVNYFSAQQAHRLLVKFEQRTRGSGAAGLWPDVIAAAREI